MFPNHPGQGHPHGDPYGGNPLGGRFYGGPPQGDPFYGNPYGNPQIGPPGGHFGGPPLYNQYGGFYEGLPQKQHSFIHPPHPNEWKPGPELIPPAETEFRYFQSGEDWEDRFRLMIVNILNFL